MLVRGNLAFEQAHSLRAACFAKVVQTQARALPWVHRSTSLEVGQSEVALAIPTIGGPEQREEGGVLRERKELAVAPGPAFRREVEREDADFSDERVCHGSPFYVGDGKMPNSEIMKSTQRYGWKLACGCVPPLGATVC